MFSSKMSQKNGVEEEEGMPCFPKFPESGQGIKGSIDPGFSSLQRFESSKPRGFSAYHALGSSGWCSLTAVFLGVPLARM